MKTIHLPPWGVELNKQVVVFGDGFIEGIVVEDENTIVIGLFGFNEGHEGEGNGCKEFH